MGHLFILFVLFPSIVEELALWTYGRRHFFSVEMGMGAGLSGFFHAQF